MKKKSLITLIAVLTVCAAALTSCGGSDSSSEGSTQQGNTSQSQQADSGKDVSAIADKLKSEIKYVDTLNELGQDMIGKIIGVKDDLYTAAKVYVGSGGMTAEEIACFEAKDEASAAEIKKALETRIENQKTAFVDYQPGEMPKLNDPVLTVSGKYVFMCLSDDNAKAREIIG